MNYLRIARPEITLSIAAKIARINWLLVLLLVALAAIGVTILYSASGGSFSPYSSRHAIRFAIALGLMFALALVDIRVWMMLAYPTYAVALLLLVGVAFFGETVMGAQRWLDIGPVRLQPSEMMKLALVLGLARYFHANGEITRFRDLVVPVLMMVAPVLLILKQPDLGTGILVAAIGVLMIYLAGLSWRVILVSLGGAVIGLPLFMAFGLKEYQWRRIRTFLNPEHDPLGSGYHLLQSKIAIGSGGVDGKGFLNGSQSHLNFLPEKQTDFIFTMIGEEFGFLGSLTVLGIYMAVLVVGFYIAIRSRSAFGRMIASGVTITFGLYVLVNVGMVIGLLPVVGVPLPLISYGGTVILSVMVGFALVMNAHIHRDSLLPSGKSLIL
ncbi:Rod shape-determining protein RodA [hydrothermal vent metagenome]|uniref:Rod shape-determining protein RodA n=1 Tax=hydrothermal vent metagenome TaxID=652676 RepID=A0A3B0RVR9_9ZZZZ